MFPFVVLFFLFACDESSDSTSEEEYLDPKAAFNSLQDTNNYLKYTFENISENHDSSYWDFGDNEISSENSPTHTYSEGGTYSVNLSVYTKNGKLSRSSATLTIGNGSKSDTNEGNPKSFFHFEQDKNDLFTYHFQNASENFSHSDWDFGDGQTSTERNPTHTYSQGGEYNIELTVSNADGTSNKSTKTLTLPIKTKEGKTLAWSDEFDGTSVNTNNWKFETGDGGWGNHELQNYTNGQNVEVSNGTLKIIAKKVGAGQNVGDYTSTRMISAGLQEFQYGIFEIRAKLPTHKGNGLWPAIWMLGSNFFSHTPWPLCGEIDIMEYVSYKPNLVHIALHTQSSSGNTVNKQGDLPLETAEEEFHNYGIIWTADEIKFYIDQISNVVYTYNPTTKTQDNWPYNQPFFFLLNIAVGGTWGGANGVDDTIFPATMEIDYVRVYQ
ncbi:family 16 glycosylhydrolase [Breoghania sp.]|uniref:family 16 glycosylhydrolase n=1 Tax=Breoghania sp. TaxID=2065378 RepID=UPI00262E98E3|nr:family 16 glycosylhydrolase [Breoghania sp.]MDJ0933704.1 family 16 glycosylhydrolase [Breoghania sp.]